MLGSKMGKKNIQEETFRVVSRRRFEQEDRSINRQTDTQLEKDRERESDSERRERVGARGEREGERQVGTNRQTYKQKNEMREVTVMGDRQTDRRQSKKTRLLKFDQIYEFVKYSSLCMNNTAISLKIPASNDFISKHEQSAADSLLFLLKMGDGLRR